MLLAVFLAVRKLTSHLPVVFLEAHRQMRLNREGSLATHNQSQLLVDSLETLSQISNRRISRSLAACLATRRRTSRLQEAFLVTRRRTSRRQEASLVTIREISRRQEASLATIRVTSHRQEASLATRKQVNHRLVSLATLKQAIRRAVAFLATHRPVRPGSQALYLALQLTKVPLLTR